MLKKLLWFLIPAVLVLGCQNNLVDQPSGKSGLSVEMSRLAAMGFDPETAVDCGDSYLVEGDVLVSKSLLEEDFSSRQACALYPGNWIKDQRIFTIKVDSKVPTGGNDYIRKATKAAIAEFNKIPDCNLYFEYVTSGTADITIYRYDGFSSSDGDAHAPYPENGNPGKGVYLYTKVVSATYLDKDYKIAQSEYFGNVAKTRGLLIHELAHTLGIAHTNYRERLASGLSDYVSLDVPGTPHADPYSLFNSPAVDLTRGLTESDKKALQALFPDFKKGYTGDFDGDGIDEILVFTPPRLVLMQYNKAKSCWSIQWTSFNGKTDGIENYAAKGYVGDFDGDGKDEYLGVGTNSSTWMTMFHYTGYGWDWGWSNGGSNKYAITPYRDAIIGDFNGDGRDDYLGIGGAWTTLFGFNRNGTDWDWLYSDGGKTSETINPYKRGYAGDFNGDGKDEFLAVGTWTTLLGFNQKTGKWDWLWSNGGKSSHGITPYKQGVVGDFDRDGKDEFFGLSNWKTLFEYEGGDFRWVWSNGGSSKYGITPYSKASVGNYDGVKGAEYLGYDSWKTLFQFTGSDWSWYWSSYGKL